MGNKVKSLFLSIAFCFFGCGVFAQEPPEPMATHEGGVDDCGTTGGLPPVGLCMPINDYLVPLLVAGIILGAYKVRKIEST